MIECERFLPQMKRYLRKKITGSGKSGKNDVIEVNIQQEDDTDYEKQWTRRMHRAQVTRQQQPIVTQNSPLITLSMSDPATDPEFYRRDGSNTGAVQK